MKITIVVVLSVLAFLIQDASAFYNPSAGRWLSRDPLGEYGGINLCNYANNDPMTFYDHLGLWMTDVHGDMIKTWLRRNPAPNGRKWEAYRWHCIEINVPADLEAGSAAVDDLSNSLTSANSYQHSMRAWYEAVSSAQAKRDAFVDSYISLAEENANEARQMPLNGFGVDIFAKIKMDEAIVALGIAQHPIADETDPAHSGFQVWIGPEGWISPNFWLLFLARHHARETRFVYERLGNAPADAVAAKMHAKLLDILRE